MCCEVVSFSFFFFFFRRLFFCFVVNYINEVSANWKYMHLTIFQLKFKSNKNININNKIFFYIYIFKYCTIPKTFLKIPNNIENAILFLTRLIF